MVFAVLGFGLLDASAKGVVGVFPLFAVRQGDLGQLVFAVPAVMPALRPEAFFILTLFG